MRGQYRKVDERTGKILFWLSWLVYFSSYLGRLNYSSAMSSIMVDGILTRSQAGVMLPLAILWIFGFRWINRVSGNAEGISGEGTTVIAEKQTKTVHEKECVSFAYLLKTSGLLMILFPVWIHGMLKDGVTQWVPTYICDSYDVSASFSVIMTMILPVINLSGAYLARFVQKRRPDREMENSAIFFAVATIALAGLLLLNGVNAILSILLFAVITSSMLAVNTLYISMIPMHYESLERVSTVSGFLNAMAYIGSAVSTFTIGVMVEKTDGI